MRLPRRLAISAFVTLLTTPWMLTACGHPAAARWSEPGSPAGPPSAVPSGTADGPAAGADGAGGSASAANGGAPGPGQGRAPTAAFAVGVRRLTLQRGADRPLPTTVWYPVVSKGSAKVAAGRFPLVLFSHGLTGYPEAYEGLLSRLAAAGFVVAAPAYPYTKRGATSYNPLDVLNQPADAWYVIGEVRKLDTAAGDPLAGHLDNARVGIAGHSAGGYTTAGMLGGPREAPVAGAVVIAGGTVTAFSGPSTPVLYVHGDRDPTVGYANGRAAYQATPWPKAFLTVLGGGHWEYLAPGAPGFDATVSTTTDLFRWTLYGDATAKTRIPNDAKRDPATRTEAALG